MSYELPPVGDFAEQMNAAAGPLRRMSAIMAQIASSAIPVDVACYCLCSIYEPHQCGGWRGDGLVREVPGGKLFGKQLPVVEVPVCGSCDGVAVRRV